MKHVCRIARKAIKHIAQGIALGIVERYGSFAL